MFNVKDAAYGAKGDGVTDDRPAIQAALDACRMAGGGEVYVPGSAGAYLLSSTTHPKNAAYAVALVVGANTTLRGDGCGASVLKLLPSCADQTRLMMNLNFDSGGDEHLTLVDLGFDGQAAAISPAPANGHYGVCLMRVRHAAFTRCLFRDFYGTAASGTGETFFTDFSLGTDCTYTDCQCVATSPHTASGFSANSTTLVSYVGCTARGMGVSNGFTHNNCAALSHVNCAAYANASYGFNSEVSHDVTYTTCHAGVLTTNAATYPYAAGTALGNTRAGFVANSGAKLAYVGCHAHRTASGPGLWIVGLSGACSVVGGSYSDNTMALSLDAPSRAWTRISGSPDLAGGGPAFSFAGTSYSPPRPLNDVGLTPAVPASGGATNNSLPFPVRVLVAGGAGLSASIDNGPYVPCPSGTYFTLQPGNWIGLNYVSAPTWTWWALV